MTSIQRAQPGAPTPGLSVIVPCFNEVNAIADTVRTLDALLAREVGEGRYELIVVDDGSTDGSAAVLARLAPEVPRLSVVTHHLNRGYGASLKTGVRRARGDRIAITDADGTYPHARLPDLLREGGTMVVGARVGDGVDYSKVRAIPKVFLRAYAQWITREEIPDINSGMRVFDRALAMRHLHILPNGFSFTTTITMAALLEDEDVRFVPISYAKRIGNSKIAPVRDTLRFIGLIVRTGMYFAPLRILTPLLLIGWLGTAASLAQDVFWVRDLRELSMLLVILSLNLTVLALIADMTRRRTER